MDATTMTAAERLRVLANHLKTVPDARFDMARWSCGTTMCAMGHATDIPVFKEMGLQLTYMDPDADPSSNRALEAYIFIGDTPRKSPDALHLNLHTACELFRITMGEAQDLFCSSGTREKIIDDIRNLANKYARRSRAQRTTTGPFT